MVPSSRRVEVVVRGQPRVVGGFTVSRALPAPQRRGVGPFVLLDHLGPTDLPPGEGMDVGPHPHMGLATVTYLFEGVVSHRDSLGSAQDITPGAVSWMSAGKGITHSERTPHAIKTSGGRVHGVQAWVGLPVAEEHGEPSFVHHAAGELPCKELDGVKIRVLVGAAFGLASPVRCASPTLYVDVELEEGATLTVGEGAFERALYLASGSIQLDGEAYFEGELVVLRPGADVSFEASCTTRLLLLGGAPLDGQRHMLWNFVASDEATLQRAQEDWREGRFPAVVGDDGPPLPFPLAPALLARGRPDHDFGRGHRLAQTAGFRSPLPPPPSVGFRFSLVRRRSSLRFPHSRDRF